MSASVATGTVGLFEIVLEVADLDASERFYREVIGLPVANRWGEGDDDETRQAVFLEIGPHSFLGLWPAETGGENAIAGGRGGVHVHFALLVEYGTLHGVRHRITDRGVHIVDERDFGNGNRAIYILDPDNNVLELTERRTDWAGAPMADVPVMPAMRRDISAKGVG